ncbi:MAG: protease inhibitor I42 family protein [Dehalococcoidia bacterium]|nr:MAG: protease inhibitor I42 family protein [Dehalococcoidia bacterium]
MKKYLILAGAMILALTLVTGCGSAETYSDAEQAIDIGVNQEFTIALNSNPTTGYSWQESYDESVLELVDKSYRPGAEAEPEVVGAGGTEYFQFKALQPGETELVMTYKRGWEEEYLEQLVFTVNIE